MKDVQDELDMAWASACKSVFGHSLGPLEPYGPWLGEYIEPLHVRKSMSGQEVMVALDDFPLDGKYVGLDEVNYGRSFPSLNINQLKDIDSITLAISEQVQYCGNVVLGKSSHVTQSTDVIDSHYVRSSALVNGSKYIAYSRHIHDSEYCFGQYGSIQSACAIKCSGSKFTRSFECHSSELLSDCFYCGSMQNSDHCMFSFGGRGKRYLIGNLQLTRERYAQLSQKLIGEIAEALERDKSIYSLFSILVECKKFPPNQMNIADDTPSPPFDISPLEKAFQTTTSILFGKPLSGLESYGPYLYQHVPHNLSLRSPFSHREVLIAGYRHTIGEKYDLQGRLLTDIEAQRVAEYKLEEGAVAALSASSLKPLCSILHPIAYSDLDKVVGKNRNTKGSAVTIDAQDCLMGSGNIRCKQCAYSFWPDHSESIFGCNLTWESAFLLRCSNSRKLARCFEVDSSHSCSDCLFCHNIENCEECMFCFNVKAKHYAIGNMEVGKEKYLQIKKLVLTELVRKLEKDRTLELSIYSLGGQA